MYARGRPQRLQRWYRRTRNLGVLWALAIMLFFAMLLTYSELA